MKGQSQNHSCVGGLKNNQHRLSQEGGGGEEGYFQKGKKPEIDKLSDRHKVENCVEIFIKRHFVEQSQKLKEGHQMFKGN